MPKEKNYNPVQAQRKADKAKEVKKGKAEVQSRRNEKLAQRNPERIQKQIDDLKQITESGGKLTSVEEQSLEALQKDLKAVKKARETLGDKAPTFARGGPRRDGFGDRGVLGKRRRDAEDASSSDSDVPGEIKKIPMPRDTPPPIPKEILDEWWAKRRARRKPQHEGNANLEPLGGKDRSGKMPQVAEVEAKTVYEAKPVVRDLRKEAVSAFVPTVVRLKKGRDQDDASGSNAQPAEDGVSQDHPGGRGQRNVQMEEVEDDDV